MVWGRGGTGRRAAEHPGGPASRWGPITKDTTHHTPPQALPRTQGPLTAMFWFVRRLDGLNIIGFNVICCSVTGRQEEAGTESAIV